MMGQVSKEQQRKCVLSLLEELAEKQFTGNVQINFFKGGVANIQKSEVIEIS